jgi:hypothetical protein
MCLKSGYSYIMENQNEKGKKQKEGRKWEGQRYGERD